MDAIITELVKLMIDYSADSGIFRWRVSSGRARAGMVITNLNKDGYLFVKLRRKSILLHRAAWLLHAGEWPAEFIDHINGIRDDNRIENLRVVNRLGNQRNQKRRVDNASGVTGVGFHKPTGKWRAYIRINGKDIHLGLFDAIADAVIVRKEAEKLNGFHQNHGRDFSLNKNCSIS